MKRIVTVIGVAGVLIVGTTAAVALGAGGGGHTASSASTGTTTAEKPAAKIWLCHHTGSWKHPYHLIHVSADASAAHRRHGDVDPGAGSSCPTAQPAGAKQHGSSGPGKSGKSHGKSAQRGSGAKHEQTHDETDADD